MKREAGTAVRCGIILVLITIPGALAGQVPLERVFCDPAAFPGECPGSACPCAEDALEIRFPGADAAAGPVREIQVFEPGLRIEAEAALETRSRGVSGWSFGVRHDGGILELIDVTTAGTAAEDFSFCNIIGSTDGGFVSGFVLTILPCRSLPLPLERNVLARAAYRLLSDPGTDGTRLVISDDLKASPNSPATAIQLTIQSRSKRPSLLVDGVVRRRATPLPGAPFRRGDLDRSGGIEPADAIIILEHLFLGAHRDLRDCPKAANASDDGRLNIGDPIAVLLHLFRGAGPLPQPSGRCGEDPTPDNLGCERFPGCP